VRGHSSNLPSIDTVVCSCRSDQVLDANWARKHSLRVLHTEDRGLFVGHETYLTYYFLIGASGMMIHRADRKIRRGGTAFSTSTKREREGPAPRICAYTVEQILIGQHSLQARKCEEAE
jgi:hypothetical protein